MTDFRARLLRRDVLFGPFVTLAAPEIADLFALAGFDWLWLDMEHTALSLGQVQQHILAAAGRVGTIVRVPWNDPVFIKQVLDLGCDGVIVPQIRSAEEARNAVAAAKYPPAGIRSVGIARAQRYGMAIQECVTSANDHVAVILQIEHIDAIPHANDILAVPGVDGIIVGPYDLSASMRWPGQIAHPDVVAVIESLAKMCNERGMAWGAFAPDAASACTHLDRGANLIVLSTDTMYLWKGARAALDELRAR
ncbi:MAG TPA: aldolase/citrate lyase family protein [Gemmataceae bacterium]|nr:aldolase/citrate lyase family protein [Gemmataceae bacterium]